MLTSSGYGAISPIGPAKVYRARAGRNDRAREVRTATTTGDIAALRQQVAEKTYTPDPMAIAKRILFLGGEQ